MILEKQNTDLLIIGDKVESKKATISAAKMAKLQYILTKGLYKDPITAVIAEWTNNGVDSVKQSGKNPVESPVIVEIGMNKLNQYYFSVEDKGQGLDDKDFEDICMNYLESTKESSPDTIGCYGIGMKSFLSLERPATFICRKNGVERKYFVYEGEEFVNYTLISEGKTTEENGVRAELVIASNDEKNNFVYKAKQKLAYYDTAVLVVDGQIIENHITRNNLFQWATLNANWDMHLCLKDVYYVIDWTALGIAPIPVPIALRFDLTEGIIPTPSRESYITNEKTKKLILDRISLTADYLVDKYNGHIKEFPNFLSGYHFYGTPTYSVKLMSSAGKETSFTINNLVGYSSTPLSSPKVKGMVHMTPEYLKSQRGYFFHEWDQVGYMDTRGKFLTKHYYNNLTEHFFANRKVVIVGPIFAGNVKTYLKEKHGKDVFYVRNNGHVRALGGRLSTAYENWYHILNLAIVPKTDWKARIKEWEDVVKTLTDTFIDETGVENDKAFMDWLEKKKAQQKADRLAGLVKGDYKGLGKKDGDITMAYARPPIHGFDWVFEKKAYKISDMERPHFKTVLLKETDNLENAKGISAIMAGDNIRFAVVGPREILKLPKSPQYIDMDTFESISCKPFGRLASSILFRKTVEEFDRIYKTKNGIFGKCLTSVVKDRDTLSEYANKYHTYIGTSVVEGHVITVAEQKDLFDKKLWDVYLRLKEAIKRYEFIALLKEPASWDTKEQERYVKFIRQQLLFSKKYYNDVDASILANLK